MYLVRPDSGKVFLSKNEGITKNMKILDLKKLLADKCGKSYKHFFYLYEDDITDEYNSKTIGDICNYRMTTVYMTY